MKNSTTETPVSKLFRLRRELQQAGTKYSDHVKMCVLCHVVKSEGNCAVGKAAFSDYKACNVAYMSFVDLVNDSVDEDN
jgi:hypothetical protein